MSSPEMDQFENICAFSNLYRAWRKAAKGKRSAMAVARFEYGLADHLLDLKMDIADGTYRPGEYTHFFIHEPKRRRISAAPFRDRVVHHALCNVIEPVFESRFIADSYANRMGKGTHRAIDRCQQLARRYAYVLRLDIVKHFPAIDHQILVGLLAHVIEDERTLSLVETILASSAGVLDQEYQPVLFDGDDLLAMCRPRGLPIGNLTSQFWSNCYLHPLDLFVKRELGCKGYLRYLYAAGFHGWVSWFILITAASRNAKWCTANAGLVRNSMPGKGGRSASRNSMPVFRVGSITCVMPIPGDFVER
jgi:hypothetical protein